MYLIKRYANGRFYDTVEKKYITREQIAEKFDLGESLSIVDTRSGEDVTYSVLASIDSERGFQEDIIQDVELDVEPDWEAGAASDTEPDEPESMFTQFLKMGEDLFGDYKKRYESIRKNFPGIQKDEIDKLLAALKGKKTEEKKEPGAREEFDRYRKYIQQTIYNSVEKYLDDAFKKMNLADRDQIEQLSESIDELTRKFEEMEKEREAEKRKGSTGGPDDDYSI